jgi:hypothetical protein
LTKCLALLRKNSGQSLFLDELGNACRAASLLKLRLTLGAELIDRVVLKLLQATAGAGYHWPRYDLSGRRNTHKLSLFASN